VAPEQERGECEKIRFFRDSEDSCCGYTPTRLHVVITQITMRKGRMELCDDFGMTGSSSKDVRIGITHQSLLGVTSPRPQILNRYFQLRFLIYRKSGYVDSWAYGSLKFLLEGHVDVKSKSKQKK
jgi:hypothetical protein